MKIRRKQFICAVFSVLIILSMLFSAAPASLALETSGKCGPDLYWSYSKNILTISGSGDMYDFVQKSAQNRPNEAPWRVYSTSISRVIIEEGCEGVGEYAFFNFTPIAEIIFPETSLKRIGKYAFSRCANLKKVKIPDSVESLGSFAFSQCDSLESIDFGNSPAPIAASLCSSDTALTRVKISENCREILNNAFYECFSLEEADLSHVERIEPLSFQGCALTRVSFGKELKYMLTNAFYGCSNLTDVTFDDETDPVQVSNLFLNNTPYYASLPDGVYTRFNGKVLLNKGTYAGKTLDIPNGIEVIADYAFDKSSNLTEVKIPGSIKKIGAYSFRDCSKLNSVFVPSSVEIIGENCFGKHTNGVRYENYAFFSMHGKGECAAKEYAEREGFQYVCEHDFEYVFDVPSCFEGGRKKLVCLWCGACIENTRVDPADSHDFELVKIVAASCEEDGYYLYRCAVCGEEKKDNITPAYGHLAKDDWHVISLPNCAKRGCVVKYCERCGGIAESMQIEKKKHSPSDTIETIVEATCTEPGLEAIVCTVCKETFETRETPALGHIPEDEPRPIAPPSEDGTPPCCSALFCQRCSQIIDLVWIAQSGASEPTYTAYSSAIGMMTSNIRGDVDAIPAGSFDFIADGKLNPKDILALRKINKG